MIMPTAPAQPDAESSQGQRPSPSPSQSPSRGGSASSPSAADRAARALRRRRILAAGIVLALASIGAVWVTGVGLGAALNRMSEASGAASADVTSAIARAKLLGMLSAGVAVAAVMGVLFWIARRYERELDRMHDRVAESRATGRTQRNAARTTMVRAMATLAGVRDQDTGEHIERIQAYVRVLGGALRGTRPEIDEDFIVAMVETSPLHDIGKVGVPDSILLKPGPLTDEQRSEMQKHVLVGFDTLLEVRRQSGDDDYLRIACEIAFAHHERFDGTGYPFGLAGEDIPIAARIVALADVYDALRAERVYKDAYTHEAARDIILEHAGTHFDPDVVRAFMAHEAAFRSIGDGASAERGTTEVEILPAPELGRSAKRPV
ncbi:MAG: HD-GYP domain-containing protein [Phycisphaerales bacterium]